MYTVTPSLGNCPGTASSISLIIGADLVAKAQADGHTVLISTASFAINPGIYRKLPYSPDDFAPVTLIVTSGGLFLITNPSVPARNVRLPAVEGAEDEAAKEAEPS